MVGEDGTPYPTPRPIPPGALPLVDCEGTARECGVMLGRAWREVLRHEAAEGRLYGGFMRDSKFKAFLSRHAPHLSDLYCGLAEGAELRENQVGPRLSPEDIALGCTSFAVAPEAALDGRPISGQNKDVSVQRGMQLLVLRLRIAEGPSALTLTYPAWLFGHGFVRGGTAIFRNSLYVTPAGRGIPVSVWGVLALHCPSVEDVMKLTRDLGVRSSFHVTVADEHGGIVGIENGKGGPAFLKPKRGIYAHANNVLSGKRMLRYETGHETFTLADSQHRAERLRALLNAERGRITAQTALRALSDHEQYPSSLCRHQPPDAWTAATVIAEPTAGLLHVTRGAPCQNWPRIYSL